MWVKILKFEHSNFNNSILVYFKYHEKIVYSIISIFVLKYLKYPDLKNCSELFILKSFNKNGKVIYLIKKIK